MVCCPDTRQDLRLASEAEVAAINERIGKGALRMVSGEHVSEPVDAALVRADGKVAYAVREDIPVLLAEEGMIVEGLL